MLLYVLTRLWGTSLCPVYHLFGIRCFGCGLTRGFICILEGDPVGATNYHILSVPLFASIALYALLHITDILFSRDYVAKIDRFLSRKIMFPIYGIILAISYYLNGLS